MERHRLRREIIATHVTNSLVDRAGSTFAFRLHEETGAPASDVARAYAAAREIYDMRRFWAAAEALDNVIPVETQIAMLLEARKLVERATRWLLHHRRPIDIAATVSQFTAGAEALSQALPEILVEGDREAWEVHVDELKAVAVPEELARWVASLGALFSALDVIEVANTTGEPVHDVAGVHFLVGHRLRLHWLRDRIGALPREDRWQAMARAALRDDLFALHGALTSDVLHESPREGGDPAARLDAWADGNAAAVERCRGILSDIHATGAHDLTTLAVALREVRTLIETTAPVTG
jgi:glutamate dehydrogenase